MERWKDEGMEGWKDRGMEGWEDGGWKDGGWEDENYANERCEKKIKNVLSRGFQSKNETKK